MLPIELYQRFSAQVTLGTGDASKTLLAGVAGARIFVNLAKVTCLVSAAQAVYVGDTSGTVKALSLAASYPLHSEARTESIVGLQLTSGEDLIIKPAAAGPSFHCVVDGYIVRG